MSGPQEGVELPTPNDREKISLIVRALMFYQGHAALSLGLSSLMLTPAERKTKIKQGDQENTLQGILEARGHHADGLFRETMEWVRGMEDRLVLLDRLITLGEQKGLFQEGETLDHIIDRLIMEASRAQPRH